MILLVPHLTDPWNHGDLQAGPVQVLRAGQFVEELGVAAYAHGNSSPEMSLELTMNERGRPKRHRRHMEAEGDGSLEDSCARQKSN